MEELQGFLLDLISVYHLESHSGLETGLIGVKADFFCVVPSAFPALRHFLSILVQMQGSRGQRKSSAGRVFVLHVTYLD